MHQLSEGISGAILTRETGALVALHRETLDPHEIKAIAGLAPGAAAAYDHLEAELAKREVDSLKSNVELLPAQLAEAQIQPA